MPHAVFRASILLLIAVGACSRTHAPTPDAELAGLMLYEYARAARETSPDFVISDRTLTPTEAPEVRTPESWVQAIKSYFPSARRCESSDIRACSPSRGGFFVELSSPTALAADSMLITARIVYVTPTGDYWPSHITLLAVRENDVLRPIRLEQAEG